MPDNDGTILDWIRSGIAVDGAFADVLPNPDENQVFEGVLGGTWAPTEIVAFNTGDFTLYAIAFNHRLKTSDST